MSHNRPPSNFDVNSRVPNRSMQGLVDYSAASSVPEIWAIAGQKFGDTVALHNPHADPQVVFTYSQLAQHIELFAAGLQALGVHKSDRVALIADNSPRWMIADQGIMTAGAVDVVRGGQAEREELLFILENSGSTALVIEDSKILNKLRDGLKSLPISTLR